MDKVKTELSRLYRSSLARNAGWVFFGQGLSMACQAGYFILLGRLLGSAEYGSYVGAVAMVSILSQYSSVGTSAVFLRYVSPDHKNFSLYWGNVLVTTLTVGSLFVVLLTTAGPYFAKSYSWVMLLCVALGDCICTQLTAAAARVFQAFEKMRVNAGLGLLVNLLRMVLAGLMLWRLRHGTAQEWAVAALIVSSIASAIAVVMVTRLFGKPRFSLTLLWQRMSEGFVFALSYSTSSIYNDIDKAMLGHYGMNAANGVYTMAYRVTDVCTAPISSVHAAAFPRFFVKGVEGVRSTMEYALRILKRTAPLALLSTVGMLVAAPIIPHLVGKDFGQSVLALRWLSLLPFFRSFQLSAGDAVTAAGHQNLRFGAQAVAAIFNFGVNLYLIPRYSWHGAAWSSLATDGLLAVFNWGVLLWLIAAKESQERKLVASRAE